MSTQKRPLVCSYYFPNWHVDPRNEILHGKNWTEWRLVEFAKPRFPGHEQPKHPLYGFEDESAPAVMSRKIDDAAGHGIDAFIFDWYWYADGGWLERALSDGFMKAPSRGKIKFALMWANHTVTNCLPAPYYKVEPIWEDIHDNSPKTFLAATRNCIDRWFREPDYLRVDGKLYFSFFQPSRLIDELGGVEATRLMLDDFRRRTAAAGLGELVFDTVLFGWTQWDDPNLAERVKAAGFDMVTGYNWRPMQEGNPVLSYEHWSDSNAHFAEDTTKRLNGVIYNPVVCAGWDCSPRTVQSDMFDVRFYPWTEIVTGNTPELLERAFRRVAEFTRTPESTAKIIQLACWNEWTEGAYLEPDEETGYGRLEAVKRVVDEVLNR